MKHMHKGLETKSKNILKVNTSLMLQSDLVRKSESERDPLSKSTFPIWLRQTTMHIILGHLIAEE